jgi:hypothetical protein
MVTMNRQLFLTTVLLLMILCTSSCMKKESEVPPIKSPDKVAHVTKPRDFDYPKGGIELGQGWSSNEGRKMNPRCIVFSPRQDPAEETVFDSKQVVDKSLLMEQLDVSAEARVKAIVGSGGAKVHYVSSVQVDQEQSNFSAHARVDNGAYYVAPQQNGQIDLSEHYAQMARTNLAEFRRECGDSYVSAIYGGAEIWAFLTFHVYSIDEKKAISESIDGSGWGGVVSASGEANKTMRRYSESKQFTVSYYKGGGNGDPIATDQEGLINAIKSLPNSAKSAPKYFTITVERYDRLPSWPDKKSDWLYTNYEDIASQYEKLSSLNDSVETMIKTPSDYVLGRGVSIATLQTIEVALLDHMKSLKKRANDCLGSDGANCSIDRADEVSDYEFRIQLPVRYVACQGCIDLDKANKSRDQAKLTLDARYAAERGFGSWLHVSDPERFAGDRTHPEQAAYNQALAIAAARAAEYPQALRDSISSQWIEIPARARCDQDILDKGCINEAQRQELKKRILIQ